MNIDTAIRIFATFLSNSWEVVKPLLKDRSYTFDEQSVSDWMQANWELLVERKVLEVDNEYLCEYGEGAEFYSKSSRITDINKSPTYEIEVKPKIGKKVYDTLNEDYFDPSNLEFDELVGFKNGFYTKEPKFEYALLLDNNLDINDLRYNRVVAFEEIEFGLRPFSGY